MIRRAGLTAIILYFLVYIMPLGARPAIIPDETRYGEIPREMIASGDWVVPRLDGVRYFEKPVLGYWLNAVSIKLFGENNFAIRFPSAVAVGLSALLIYAAACAFAGSSGVGLLAAVIYLTCLGVFGIGTFNVLDSMFSMFVTAALTAFLYVHTAVHGSVRRSCFLVCFGICSGLAFLVKGFLAFVIPIIVIVPFLVWEKRSGDLLRIPWIPIATALLIVLPWAIMIHLREPDFWNFFIFNEHFRRFLADNAQHSRPFWYFLPVLAAAALPWTFLFPAAVSGLKTEGFGRTLVRYASCWFLIPFVFFSVSEGKMGTYILPCFPPLCILLAFGMKTYREKVKGRLLTGGIFTLGMAVVTLAIALTVIQWVGVNGIRPYDQNWKLALLLIALALCAVLELWAAGSEERPQKLMLFFTAPVFLLVAINFTLPDITLAKKAPEEFLAKHADRIRPNTILVTDHEIVSAACWFYKRNDIYLFQSGGELDYGLQYKDASFRLVKEFTQLRELISQHRATGGTVVVTSSKIYDQWKNKLPAPLFTHVDHHFTFAKF